MKHKHLALTLGALIIGTLISLISCRKINEATTLGGGLIPIVDNIYTFDTTLDVETFNDTFTLDTDPTLYSSNFTHFLGQINDDPFFGKTDAKLYLELKPQSYRHTFSNVSDSLHLDSVVLILDYAETYGDTMVAQTVNVYEIPQSSNFGDTILPVRKSNYEKGALLGSRTFVPFTLNDTIKAYKDTTANQLRIRLSDAFGQRLLSYDTTINGGGEPAYISDSAFRTHFKGFALESVSGNAIMGFNLTGVNTKLAIYYRDDNGDPPVAKWDTTVAYFIFAQNGAAASANFIQRDYAGKPIESAAGGTDNDDVVYIQNTPGSFAKIKIPGLANVSNRIVHRAELIMEQLHDPGLSDTTFPPAKLYLDAFDSSGTVFRAIPYDVSVDGSGAANLSSFGINPVDTKDSVGKNIKSWRFNITRYIQHVVNDTEPIYDLRLSAPLYLREYYRPGPAGSTSVIANIFVNDAIGKGRVRLGGGGKHQTQKQRMRLRIVYSKI
ncbi:MAG TPA: DUF4270 family protein [Chitinophagaceae bacterium]|nr:DUF4270 family protein [Chitinophagaceae bacterium]